MMRSRTPVRAELSAGGTRSSCSNPNFSSILLRMKKRLFCLPACAALALPAFGAGESDAAAVRQLNERFIRAFLDCDVASYRALLADDFLAVLADGRVINK